MYSFYLEQENKRFKKKYQHLHQLNVGHFSMLSKGLNKQTNKAVIIATLYKKPVYVPEEVKILKKLKNEPGIAGYIDHFQITSDTHYLIIEYFGSMTLKNFLSSFGNLSEKHIHKITSQLLSTIQVCTSLNILHKNIKSSCVLIDISSLKIKLTNFGFACFFKNNEQLTSKLWYDIAPPEYFIQKSYTANGLNVWCLGLLLYKMLFEKNAFETIHDIMFSPCKISTYSYGSTELKELILRCLDKSCKTRITLQELTSHSWITKK